MIDNYKITEDGVIQQIDVDLITYDLDYVNKSYVVYEPLPTYMSYLRLGNIIGSLNSIPKSILDVGYGNGSFLKICNDIIPECYGYDISGYPIPNGCKRVDNILENYYEVITFFDSLEHFENIDIVKNLKCKYVCISVPNCHYYNDDWFYNWKHRRPNEHLWHFNEESLKKFMNRMGYELITSSNIEDTIRKNNKEETNILTCVFKKMEN